MNSDNSNDAFIAMKKADALAQRFDLFIQKYESDTLSLRDDMKRILGFLENDDKVGEKGAINRLRIVEDYIELLKEERNISRGKKTVREGIFGAIGGGIIWFFIHLKDVIHFFQFKN